MKNISSCKPNNKINLFFCCSLTLSHHNRILPQSKRQIILWPANISLMILLFVYVVEILTVTVEQQTKKLIKTYFTNND